MSFEIGSVVVFMGAPLFNGEGPYLGELFGVAAVDPMGMLTCSRIDWRGRVFERRVFAVAPEDARLVPTAPIPSKRFPAPWGDADNEEDDPDTIWTGCPIGHA